MEARLGAMGRLSCLLTTTFALDNGAASARRADNGGEPQDLKTAVSHYCKLIAEAIHSSCREQAISKTL